MEDNIIYIYCNNKQNNSKNKEKIRNWGVTKFKMKAIEIKKLKKSINGKLILKEINLNIYEGEIYSLLGPNGAGKTTTIYTLLGLLKKDDGEIKIFGEELSKKHFKEIGLMFEIETYNLEWSVIDNLKHMCYLFGVDEHRIYDYVEMLDLKREDFRKKFKQLSKGTKRKISLIGALIHDPKILILDEPTSGLDPEIQVVFKKLLLDLKKRGKTVLFVSHNLYEVQEISDRIGFIKSGETIFEIPVSEKFYLVEGDYPEFQTYRVKNSKLYVFDEKMFLKIKPKNYQMIEKLEDLYAKFIEGRVS
ncbi:ABC transporter related protein [Caldicellulosiruptor hydrothermalis 108]|uniref:ABC transporter related protein n=2 Tax=Caldicellulosiruptor TaxID=44000 RepID=E4QD17_CALH1|nr:ABC transporter related protein [Caldicellulosiruptor hydrothermalis 108]